MHAAHAHCPPSRDILTCILALFNENLKPERNFGLFVLHINLAHAGRGPRTGSDTIRAQILACSASGMALVRVLTERLWRPPPESKLGLPRKMTCRRWKDGGDASPPATGQRPMSRPRQQQRYARACNGLAAFGRRISR